MKQMVRIALLLFALCFSLTLMVGESLCCDEGVQSTSSSADAHNLHFDSKNHSHQSDDSQGAHSGGHRCVGCAHAPVALKSYSLTSEISETAHVYGVSPHTELSDVILDGPFQPPRSRPAS